MSSTKPGTEVKNGFQVPKWAGKPPSGLHLDVMKDGKMFQKLMIDDKNCYFFGRNKDTVDFVTDHASCSRVHAALVWHKHLNRSFIIDLGSAHGTHIGSIRLDANKPQQVFIDSELKFGASTRTYIIREKPQANKHFPSMLTNSNTNLNDSIAKEDNEDYHNNSLNSSLALPETEAELDNLTEFNTAHNKRISQIVVENNTPSISIAPKKKKKCVSICEEEDVINPEDIDPSVGRFRNMIQTTVFIPNKKKRPSQQIHIIQAQAEVIHKRPKQDGDEEISTGEYTQQELYSESEEEEDEFHDEELEQSTALGFSMGINLAPDVDENKPQGHNESETIIRKQQQILQQHQQQLIHQQQQTLQLQRQHIESKQLLESDAEFLKKKIYAKEAWPGRKPAPTAGSADSSLSLSVSVSSNVSPAASKVSPGTGLSINVSKPGIPGAASPKKTKSPQKAPKRLLI